MMTSDAALTDSTTSAVTCTVTNVCTLKDVRERITCSVAASSKAETNFMSGRMRCDLLQVIRFEAVNIRWKNDFSTWGVKYYFTYGIILLYHSNWIVVKNISCTMT